MNDEKIPLVSIITATYNRSNVLRYAILSVIQQTFVDWELIIVDDASKDDTKDVVDSFRDNRIRYIRMDRNIGEQSGPNNFGFHHTRGRYIAYLSHDDLWFPEHLEIQLESIRVLNADWVCSLGFMILPSKKPVVVGVLPDGAYNPRYFNCLVASLWLLKREVIVEIGDWKFYRTIRIPPSQDMLMRAWKAGKTIRMNPYPTVIIIHSGLRAQSYINREFEENKLYFEKIMSDTTFRESMLLSAILEKETENILSTVRLPKTFYKFIACFAKRIGLVFGIFPIYLFYGTRYFIKGSFVDSLRKIRGLPRLNR